MMKWFLCKGFQHFQEVCLSDRINKKGWQKIAALPQNS
ncbi:hypothetical protein FLA_5870 [Filimonas lacunae]|nr:hypothetical protein FLA_5870 [Filimonas lacunae]